jgi:hypothetical protein
MKNVKKLKSEKLKVRDFALSLFTFIITVCGLIILLGGCCCDQPGETAAEGSRRHERVLRINQQEMMVDIDRILLLDRPSELTDLRIP